MENHRLESIHPEFWTKIIEILPPQELAEYRNSLIKDPVTAVRHHLQKAGQEFSKTEQLTVLWHPRGQQLKDRPEFSPDPYFHSGSYYVQDPSAMFLYHILNELKRELPENPLIADICAAPGGKSTLLLDFLEGQGLLLSNELVPKRNAVLRDNLVKWGYLNVINSRKDPNYLKKCGAIFDLLIVDAPCSGEGMFRKSKAARKAWSSELVVENAKRQKNILLDSMALIKPGGFMIYCNCTMNITENENVVLSIAERKKIMPVDIYIPEDWNIFKTKKDGFEFYRFFPHRISGEGMTYCVFQKENNQFTESESTYPSNLSPLSKKQKEELLKFIYPQILENGQFYLHEKGEVFYLLNDITKTSFHLINQIQASPLPLGEFRKDLFIPSHFIVMAGLQNPQIPTLIIEKEQVRLYLKKTPFKIDTKNIGWAIVRYQDQLIGWVKIHSKGGKFTNYYPNSLRLLNY